MMSEIALLNLRQGYFFCLLLLLKENEINIEIHSY